MNQMIIRQAARWAERNGTFNFRKSGDRLETLAPTNYDGRGRRLVRRWDGPAPAKK